MQNQLSEANGKILLQLARETIADKLGITTNTSDTLENHLSNSVFGQKRGTFVTLKIDGCLRGCIGCLTPFESIKDGIKRNALNSAFNDNRFMPLSVAEYDKLHIEISILTEPEPLEYKEAADLFNGLRPHIDGVILKKGIASATFLPQVWEQLPGPEDFLGHLCMKAGLGPNEWKKGQLDVLTYQVQLFEEE